MVLTSNPVGSEDPGDIAADVVGGIEGCPVQPAEGVVVELNRARAIAAALAVARDGDTVAISGMGRRPYSETGQLRAWDDHVVVELVLGGSDP